MQESGCAVLQKLIEISNTPPALLYSGGGICYHILDNEGNTPLGGYGAFDRFAQKWPKFTGNGAYPVPVPDWDYVEEDFADARRAYASEPNKWVGQYGKLRRELLDFVIGELVKELYL